MDKIKAEFNGTTGEDFDAMFALDIPNFVGGNTDGHKPVAKTMLYNDPFLGIFDSGVREGASKEYESHARLLSKYALESKNYGYIFEVNAELCNVLSLKYDFGTRIRAAYKENDNAALSSLAPKTTRRTREFIIAPAHMGQGSRVT